MAATIGPQKGGLVVARADQVWQLQMVRGTMCGSQNWSRTIRGCHNWSPRTVGGWDQFSRDRPLPRRFIEGAAHAHSPRAV